MADIFPYTPTGDVKESDSAVVTILGTDTQFRVLEPRGQAFSTLSFSYEQITHAERLAFLNYFQTKLGKYIPFWLRSWHTDFVLSESATAGLSYIYTEKTSIRLTFDLKPLFIYIPYLDFATRVLDVQTGKEDPVTKEIISDKLILADTLPANININLTTPCKIERIYYVRFDQDTLSFQHKKMFLSSCSIKFKEMPKETPLSIVHP